MVKISFNKKAMTLLEVIVAIMLVLVVIGAGITPFIIQQNMIKSHMVRSDIQDQVSISMAYINKDIFRAEEIIGVGIGGSSITIGIGIDFNPGPDEYITYALSGTDLQRNGNTITRHITGLAFILQSDNFVGVTITASKDGQSITSSTAIALRAKSGDTILI
jgi:hypothetical protein